MTIIQIALALVGVGCLLAIAEALGRALQRFDRLRNLADEARDEETP
jgi:hypothetical protein